MANIDIEAQDNGTVHHLWWQSNNLKYTQSHYQQMANQELTIQLRRLGLL